MTPVEEAIKADLISHLQAWDASRARSQQKEIGASELHGCRRQVWYKINNQEPVNQLKGGLGALLGTGFHNIAEDAYGPEAATEYTAPGLPEIGLGDAHIDRWDYAEGRVVDYKTVKLKDMGYLPKEKHFTQAQVYADRLVADPRGHSVSDIAIIYIPRDGEYKDIAVYVRPYDPRYAQAAYDWLLELQSMTEPPPPDYSGKICSDYCPFYHPTTCLGR